MPFDRREIRYNGHVIPPPSLPLLLHKCGVSDPNLLSAERKPKRRSEGERMFEALMLKISMSVGNRQIKKIISGR